ncbi:ATP-binding protein [Frankia tisae]|uniref:ATP-binding protein n=1 Tax=Frankia tisae TaxID=2950104 RepID=UPI0021C08B10|nr:ATP-binding protein [Frankia tisae]
MAFGDAALVRLRSGLTLNIISRVLIWLNGPNGIGKTQVAYELHRGLAGSFVCDPEHLGFALRRMLPASLRGDFRDMPLWRDGIANMLCTVLDAGDGPVIVPMTALDPGLLAALVEAVAADIAADAGLAFAPDPAGPARRRVRRLGVQLRHIRFDELVGLPR